jgi:hypothetical protein
MFGLYKDTAVLAFQRAVKGWLAAVSLIVYAVAMLLAMMIASNLGPVGGFALGFAAAACASGYLHFLSQAVQGRKVSLAELSTGFKALFWDVISVMFALWIIGFVVQALVGGAGENGPAIAAMVGLAMAFFLNPVPELIYQGQSRSFRLLLDSCNFVLAHPVAWFLPNLLFAVVALGSAGQLAVSRPGELLLVFSSLFSVGGIFSVFASVPRWALPLLLLLFHYAMVFRGLLFQGLAAGNNTRRRQWEALNRR